MQTITASEFKARCLALLDHVAETGEGLTVLKRGIPVAQVLPAVPRESGFPQEALLGSVEVLGDIVSPVLAPDAWESLGRRA